MLGLLRFSQPRPSVLVVSFWLAALFLFFYLLSSLSSEHSSLPFSGQCGSRHPQSDINMKNLAMSNDQCEVAFPGLFVEIDRMVAGRKGRKIRLDELEKPEFESSYGYIRAMIRDNQLYVITANDGINSRRLATLHSLHQAIITSPHPFPNSEFVLATGDKLEGGYLAWAFARDVGETTNSTWLMPDFGHWSWPEPKVGSFIETLLKADAVDAEYISPRDGKYSLDGKENKLVWRGADLGLDIRKGLFDATKDKPWSDIKTVDWGNPESVKNDLLTMSDHCRYKFLAHVEGYSYSGRLKYLQACHSVIIAHKLNWVQHYHSLMVLQGPLQNFVEVKRDWSDLEEKIQFLMTNPAKAEEIAARSREVWRRYLSPAATNCYWRRLFVAWGELLDFEPQFYSDSITLGGKGKSGREWRGVPFESFSLLQKIHWDPM
ncbi:uncharacterized protein LAJ45_08730 [Morchella importuna]|uniref:uncharacterized protein n=1 Tax=Morchella importuna TaxID=1174673 RepID=UPI001E8EDD7A|nr:uncharacterized protein LAJ45_08730 [Morchella importuna]KAH8147252.1 hypothetical protein LAJ45_08730 [Morchella importuna]